MTQAGFTVVPSVYLFLLRENDEPGQESRQVLLQRRDGTAYMDRWWACAAAGHVERGESALHAMVREAREELGVHVEPDDLEPLATVHRTTATHRPDEERIDLFFVTRRWHGQPHVAEPDRAAEVAWWPVEEPPERMVPHEARALDVLAEQRHAAGATVLTHGFDQRLTLVAAVGANGVIGDGSAMPWHLPEDLRHFKRLTLGGVLLMGRRTFESIGGALPGRRTVVITRDERWSAEGVEVAHTVAEALLIAGDGEVFVVGGGEIYRQLIEVAQQLVITEVHQSPSGTVTFPDIDPQVWTVTERHPHDGFDITTWTRRGPEGD